MLSFMTPSMYTFRVATASPLLPSGDPEGALSEFTRELCAHLRDHERVVARSTENCCISKTFSFKGLKMANPMYPPRLEPDRKEVELQQSLAECVLSASWMFTCVGVGLAIPVGIRTKSYVPLVTFGGGGTVLDMIAGVYKCGAQRRELRDYHSERLLAEGATANLVQEQKDSGSA